MRTPRSLVLLFAISLLAVRANAGPLGAKDDVARSTAPNQAQQSADPSLQDLGQLAATSHARLAAESGADTSDADRVSSVPTIPVPRSRRPDPNDAIYYKNKFDVSVEGGWLPINVPFMFDVFVGDAYITEKVHYTMVPVFVSIDWQTSHYDGPWFLRGTWDATFGGTAASVARGPESKFFGYHMGIRRNFVQRRWKVVPYIDGRVGIGHIDARGPQGVWGAQGQDLTFSLNISSGLRYQISKHYSISMGPGYMHISNMYLSLPRYANNGINVTGMMFGVHYRIPTREERSSTQQ